MLIFLEQNARLFLGLQPVLIVILLSVLGLVFLGVEIFILPGFGIAGVLGLILLVGSAVSAWMLLGSTWGVITVVVTIVVTIALLVTAFRARAVRRRLVLDTHLQRGGGTAAEGLADLIGAEGVAKSDLHPAGIAIIDDRRVDVVSDGGFIERGQKIKVVDVDGPRVVVARID